MTTNTTLPAGVRARRLEQLAFAGAAVVTLAWAAASLMWPYGWDHGIFATIGDAIVRGGDPYRSGWDTGIIPACTGSCSSGGGSSSRSADHPRMHGELTKK